MNAAIYARRSDDQAELADREKSITRQVERARLYAENKGWTIAESNIFVDDGIRGSEFAKRQSYMRLLNSLKPRPPFDILIVSELSRLGREQFETGYAAKQLSQAGVRIVSYLEDREILLATATDKFLLAAVNFAAEVEREKARQRVTDAMTRKAARGHVCGGDCFGYHNIEVKNPDGRRSHVDRHIDEDQAAVVRRIFAMCADGHGLKTITKQLNGERLPAPRPRQGRPRGWTPSTVRTVLYRDLYRGISVWNRRRATDGWGQRACRPRPEAEWIRASVEHLRIVTDEQWDTAHRRLESARQNYAKTSGGRMWGRPPSGVQSKYLLSGLMRCSCCGASLTVHSSKHGTGQRLFYVCASYEHRGRTVCDNSMRLPVTMADEAILAKLSRYVLDPAVVEGAIADALAELQPSRSNLETRRTTIQSEVRKVDAEIAKFVAAIAVAGQVDALAEAIREREQQRSRLKAELLQLDSSDRLSSRDIQQLEGELRTRLSEWRQLLDRHTDLARPVVGALLDGRIAWTPRKKEGLYEFSGRAKFDGALTGAVSVFPQGLVPVRGFEPRFHG